ncbi:MAG: serine/threonine protein kinase [Gammaproteobacteria bacterium]|nr:serine/threonine protein kinase [Gammaproteobacteria bacterium]
MAGEAAGPRRPYADLTPDCVLDAVESLGFVVDGRLLPLNSYENRVYQVGLDDTAPVIAKFYRPGRWSDEAIAEEHAFMLALSEREIPAVAPLVIDGHSLHRHRGYRFSLTPRCGGRDPELEQPETLIRIGRFIARIHAVGASQPFRHRPTLTYQLFGVEPSQYLIEQGWIPAELTAAYTSVLEQALTEVAACFERAGPIRSRRLHGDCHRGNLLWTEQGPHFVDFDDARMGPAIQDLWMLLSGDRTQMRLQLDAILEGYQDFCDFDLRELHLIEALRTLRLIHYAAWLARRWDDPAFPDAFPWFDSPRFWEEQILILREQIAAMQEGPLSLL